MDTTQEARLFNIESGLKEFRQESKDFHVEMLDFKDHATILLDQQIAILQRLDQERIFTTEHIRRN